MILLYAVAAGLALGAATGGRLERLAHVRFRLWPLALFGLAFQVVLFNGPLGAAAGDLAPLLYVGSSLLVLLALLPNVGLPGLWLLALGAILNQAAIVSNGGWMPASPDAFAALTGGMNPPTQAFGNSVMAGEGTALAFLGDNFAVPRLLPLANVFSVGDVLIGLGAVAFLVHHMCAEPEGSTPAEPGTDRAGAPDLRARRSPA